MVDHSRIIEEVYDVEVDGRIYLRIRTASGIILQLDTPKTRSEADFSVSTLNASKRLPLKLDLKRWRQVIKVKVEDMNEEV